MPCTQDVVLKRTDGGADNILVVHVQRGSCPADMPEECPEGQFFNKDFTSTTSCACEPFMPVVGELIDLSVNTELHFAFNKPAQFTLREWAVTIGEYEWSLLSEDEVKDLKCFTMVGEAYDNGQYRQVSFDTTTPDCRDEMTRHSMADDSVTKTYTFTVWPDHEPAWAAHFYPLDLPADSTVVALPEINIEAGTTFYVWLKENEYFPNGFAWQEPEHEFACATVLDKNFGEFNFGYKVWML
jgi:hypothetical protein